MRHLGDITKLHGDQIPVVDIITGGSPCQDLSVAGLRAGLDGERSGLFMEQIRIVKEMRAHDRRTGRTGWLVRPRFMVWENVPGAFSSNKGRDFQAVLSEIVKIAEPDAPDVPLPEGGRWSKAGCLYSEMGDWSIAWRVHDAQFWGVPQRRKRIALVADFGGLAALEILFERKGLSGDLEQSGAPGEEAAGGTGKSTESASRTAIPINTMVATKTAPETRTSFGVGEDGDPQFTLQAAHSHAVCAGFSFGQSEKARSIGYQEEISPTLRGGEGGNQKPCVYDVRGNGVMSFAQNQIGEVRTSQVSGTLNTNSNASGRNAPLVYDARGNGDGEDVAHTLKAKANCDFRADSETYPVQNSVARRLTPLECERLQGYPDGWTDIGEWIDSKGKKHKEADSPRYKALGNSIALPFWQWMARRICAQYERTPTMGSLFDGIGGFPLVFERAGAKAVWASEIEEFCVAVTKTHFPERGENL